jgi:hypothetical protein
VAEAVVSMMHQATKGLGLRSLDEGQQRTLKGAMTRAEGRIRAAGAALSENEVDQPAARAIVQEAVDEYLAALGTTWFMGVLPR